MQALGVFRAQYYKFLSTDPSTIFQFFVFPDRLALVKIGSSLNQLPSVFLSGGTRHEAVGLQDHASSGMPTLEETQAAIRAINNHKTLGLKSSSIHSREILFGTIRRLENLKGLWFANSLRIVPFTGEPLRFVLPERDEAAKAASLLKPLLLAKYAESKE